MELPIRPTLFLFLILSLHCFPPPPPGRSYSWRVVDSEAEEMPPYEIDYRGPQTHSSVPPPNHSHSSPSIQGEDNPKMKKPHN